MNTQSIPQTPQTLAPVAGQQGWEEPAIVPERALVVRAQDAGPKLPWESGFLGPLSTSGTGGGCT